MIVSPCISICKSDQATGFCYGCARNSEEKLRWKDKNTSDDWKLKNLIEIKSRMKGWQLESFEKSYNYKCVYGISLEKKRKMNFND
tara:strand:- start:1061 stop:1318 length:258 start_codon:yes stop_codon:yes gene_type:complete